MWAAIVLEGLERELPGQPETKTGFPYHIRLLTGASGGMVGAALYAAEFDEDRRRGRRQRDPVTGLSWVSNILAADSLSPVVQTMLWLDLFSIWWPFRCQHDRGRRLEETWNEFYRTARDAHPPAFIAREREGFKTTFADLFEQEKRGECPSLVFSPMLVDDARRVLISNLDLSGLSTSNANRIMPDQNAPENTLLCRSAIEFFRLFPKARNEFTLGTAARMNASFPFISPAVALPMFPPRRVIDAGFYDNFGVGLIALWLLHHEKAIRAYTSGVALIETRAFRYGITRRHFLDPDMEGELPEGRIRGQVRRRPHDPAAVAASWASSPLESLLNLRQRGAFYRNDELLQLLDARLNAPTDPSFFTTVAFECPVDAALSWALSPEDAVRVGQGFHVTVPRPGQTVDPLNHDTYDVRLNERVCEQVKQLREWFGDGGRRVPT